MPSPEHLVGDVIICDPTVGQVLIPHRIQRVPLSLRFQLVGLGVEVKGCVWKGAPGHTQTSWAR